MMADPKRASRGFGLVEVMVAIAILGVLLYFTIPAYQDYVTRAQVAEALELADGARKRVEQAFADGSKQSVDLLDSGGAPVGNVTAMTWTLRPGGGHILASMDLPRLGKRDVFALDLRTDGSTFAWHCVDAAEVGAAAPLEAKYLPSACRGDARAPHATSPVKVPAASNACPPAGEPAKSEAYQGTCVVFERPCPGDRRSLSPVRRTVAGSTSTQD